MTAYTLAANATLRDIGNAAIWGVATARSGGDTVDTNGFKLTIDQDSRYGLSGGASTTWGSLTINASKGGEIHIDGTTCWMIPFNDAGGTLTLGTQITIGGVTCNTVGVYLSLTTAPTTFVPSSSSGWLKVTNASGTPGTIYAGTYAGLTIVATGGAAVRGFIEVNGDDAATINANRLGTFRVTGAWYELGTTSGASNQTLQIPTNGQSRYFPGVFIEKVSGGGDYEFWPNAGGATSIGTEAARGKVVWISSSGVVRIGNNGTSTAGYTPSSGRKVVVPNVFFETNLTSGRSTNAQPNGTLATRYDFSTTGGGVIEIDKAAMNWYLSVSQAYSVNLSNSCFADAISLDEVASSMTFTKVGIGQTGAGTTATVPLSITECFAGGTFTDCVWQRYSMASSGSHTATMTDCSGFTFVSNTWRANTARANSTTYAINATRVQNCTWTDPVLVQGAMTYTSSAGITITDTTYVESVSSTTSASYTGHVWSPTSFCSDFLISGLSLPVTNTHPYTALIGIYNGSYNIRFRNIGTRASPLTMGSANACAHAVVVNSSSSDVKVQRVYVSGTRSGFCSNDNSAYRVTIENCAGDYADADTVAANNMHHKACGFTNSLTAASAVYGTHWLDVFTSTTAGRLYVRLNEPNAATEDYVTLTDGAAFTGAGSLYMPTIGMTATFEMDYYAIGHTGFQNSALVMAGGTVGNYRFEYAIDKNDGSGYSTMTSSSYTAAQLGTALNGLTGIDASLGFKLKLKVTTGTTNTTAITSMYLLTDSSTTAQDYQYPLDVVPVSVTVLDQDTGSPIENARVRIITSVGGYTVLEGMTNASGVLSGTTEYAGYAVTGTARRATDAYGTRYKPGSISGTVDDTAGFSSTVLLISDE